MIRSASALALTVLATSFAACAASAPRMLRDSLDPRVTVNDAGTGLRLKPRPADCHVEFFRTRPPEQPYDEIAALYLDAGASDVAAAQELLRAEACVLGADAVVVTREYSPLVGMAASAVSYRELRERRAKEAALVRERLAAMGAPEGFVPARARASGAMRSGPDRVASVTGRVKEGEALWANPDVVRGFRRVRHADGRAGYVESGLVEIVEVEPAPAPAKQPNTV